MRLRWKLAIVIAAGALLVAGVLAMARPMFPLNRGTSAEFWRHAAGIDPNPEEQHRIAFAAIHPPRDGVCIYGVQGFHEESLYTVPSDEAFADFPEVIKRLDAIPDSDNHTALAHDVLRRHRAEVENDPVAFLAFVHQAWLDKLKSTRPGVYDYVVKEEKEFDVRWACIGRYWVNVLFECAFFVGLLLFAAWPWLRNLRPWRWALHLGLVPAIFILPFFLGYAEWTFTSRGPSGGILYPWVIVWFRGLLPWTHLDQWLLEHMPKRLAPISQPLGPWISVSGGRPLGLVAAGVAGAIIAIVAAGVRRYQAAPLGPPGEGRLSLWVARRIPARDFASRPARSRFITGALRGAAFAGMYFGAAILLKFFIEGPDLPSWLVERALGLLVSASLFTLTGALLGLFWRFSSTFPGALLLGLISSVLTTFANLSIVSFGPHSEFDSIFEAWPAILITDLPLALLFAAAIRIVARHAPRTS